jgi:hypothetical protein
MTILGQHTVSETRDLIRATEFRVNKLVQLLQRIQTQRANPPTDEQLKLDDDMAKFVRKWIDVRDTQTIIMAAAVTANPSVHPVILPAEKQFVAIVEVSTRNPNTDLRLISLQNRVDTAAEKLGLAKVDLSQTPSQNSPDADFLALKKLDAAIKSGEETAKKVVKSNTGLIIGAVVAGVVGVVVVTKVYL